MSQLGGGGQDRLGDCPDSQHLRTDRAWLCPECADQAGRAHTGPGGGAGLALRPDTAMRTRRGKDGNPRAGPAQKLVSGARPPLLSGQLRRNEKKKKMVEPQTSPPRRTGPAGDAEARGEIVAEFARVARVVEDRDQLRQAFGATVRALGFEHFALQGFGARLLLADLPANWIFRPDPERDIVFAAAAHSLSPFLWSDIPRLTPLTPADTRTVEGAPPGFAVPLHGSPFSSGLAA